MQSSRPTDVLRTHAPRCANGQDLSGPVSLKRTSQGLPLSLVLESFPNAVRAPKILGLDPGRQGEEYTKLAELDRMENASFGPLLFSEAFNLWFKTHSPFISERTAHDYQQYGAPLTEFLGATKVEDIGCRTVQAYQLWRSRDQGEPQPGSFKHSAGNVRIRNEINGVLKPILKEAGLWEQIKARKFRHLPCPLEGSGMLLTKDDQREILETAFSDRRWHLAGHILLILYRTGSGFGELRKVRRRDVDLEGKTIEIIWGAKNSRRIRTLRLIPSVLASVQWIMARAEKMGAADRNDYILPHRSLIKNRHGAYDKPMTSIHYTWVAIRKAWIRRHPEKQHKQKARIYDARPSAATLLMANPAVPLPMVEKILGWRPGSRMRQRYNVADQKMMWDALSTLEEA